LILMSELLSEPECFLLDNRTNFIYTVEKLRHIYVH